MAKKKGKNRSVLTQDGKAFYIDGRRVLGFGDICRVNGLVLVVRKTTKRSIVFNVRGLEGEPEESKSSMGPPIDLGEGSEPAAIQSMVDDE